MRVALATYTLQTMAYGTIGSVAALLTYLLFRVVVGLLSLIFKSSGWNINTGDGVAVLLYYS